MKIIALMGSQRKNGSGYKYTTQIEMVFKQSSDWSRLKAMSITQNIIASGKPIDVIFVHNEDTAAGVIQALKEAGKLNNPIKVVSTNGSAHGIEMIKKGELLATANESPSTEAALAVKTALDVIYGKQVPSEVKPPIKLITKDNLGDVIAWGPDGVNKVDFSEYLK